MREFTVGIQRRVQDAQNALRQAQDANDSYEAGIHQAELADLHRIAEQHGLPTPAGLAH